MRVFVIMPFRPEHDEIFYNCLVPICTKLGLQAIRADQILDPGAIPDQIVRSIRDSLFIIADISSPNDNVFYELGYAHALNKKTILLSDKDRALPFDVRVVRTVMYDRNGANWMDALAGRLAEAIGHLYRLSEALELHDLQPGQEFKGYMHTISGRLVRREAGQHLWFFAKREDLDTWWPQDNGEVCVCRDGSWRAQLFLGTPDREEDVECFYYVKFGLVDTRDSRELTEFSMKCINTNSFPGMRQLPTSFEELAEVQVKRIR